MSTAMINEIGNYLRETVEDFDVRVEVALNIMDKMRCPFGYADCNLCDECYDRIEEWCEEHDVDVDCIDVEEIIFEMD